MNRRSFLAALGLAPVVVPMVAKAGVGPTEQTIPIYVYSEGPCGQCQLGGHPPPGPWVRDEHEHNIFRHPAGYVYGHSYGEISTAGVTLTELPFGSWLIPVS